MIDIAKTYWTSGVATLPVDNDKKPFRVKTWVGGVKDLESYRDAPGIGIVCGEASGNVECLDFDNHSDDAKDTISAFMEEISDISSRYKLPIQSTISGGYHLLYRCSEIGGNQKLASRPIVRDGKKIPDAIIETRGQGGYFVAHPTGGYKVIRGNILRIPEITPEERAFMIDVAKSFNEWHEPKRNEYEDSDRPGDKFNRDSESLQEVKDELEKAGWAEIRDGKWRRPGKGKGASATLGYGGTNVFYVFSSNAYPFDMGSYSPFSVIGTLRYDGDFKRFAKELAEKYSSQKPSKQDYSKASVQDADERKLENLLVKSYIDISIPVARPPVCFKIRDFEGGSIYEKRLLTLGNFSAITGKSKSKKSFLTSIFAAAAIKNGEINKKIVADLPPNKRDVLIFDTEQARYDAYVCVERAARLSGMPDSPHLKAYDLREFSYRDRCDIIGYALKKHKDSVGYVIIDGIADLVSAINDEDEATRISTLLMQWTAKYNCHITTVIHQNKDNNWATGWVGSMITKKSECVMSVTKDPEDKFKSVVVCDFIRGISDFNDFEIEIQGDSLPRVGDIDKLSSRYEVKPDNVPF